MDRQPTVEPIKTVTNGEKSLQHTHTFGSVRHRHEHTKEIILIPRPSQDPNDPLNWSQRKKYYMATIICVAMFMCNFLAAGPTIAIVATAFDFFPAAPKEGPAAIGAAIAKTAYFFTTTALLQGVGTAFWMPFVNKYGRRPIYVLTYTIYLGTTIWLSLTTSYASFLAGRIVMGFAAGAAEAMAPVSIADVFFLHERGTIMALYTAALSCGVAGGSIISGLITINHPWRYIYYVSIALVGTVLFLALFTFPETIYNRSYSTDINEDQPATGKEPEASLKCVENNSEVALPKKKTYWQSLRLYSGVYTSETLWEQFLRSVVLIVLPAVLWGALVMSVTIGFIVAVTSNVAVAYEATYGFEPYQTGLCFFAAIIGSIIGIFMGGHTGDWVADFLTRRNGGIRHPEMRLPAVVVSLITTPLALILYGAGIEYKLHWMCPTIGIALSTNISLVYTIDVYRPIAGEITVTSMAWKSLFGFLLSFYTNPWIDKVGYISAYGTMAAIAFFVLALSAPLYIFGHRINSASWKWRIVKYVLWNKDREVGE
ncbi:major facilitator superfamily domain-containing protein [Bisporella sp. PMI_857]|nr:major facilitator superfamily domain-containing protein [Bisporella sp. PMI_857]